jgi:L-seryl-tRNA(Ser) seleniumtransferase
MINPLDRFRGLSRRRLFQSGGLFAAARFLPAAPSNHELKIGSSIYESIGVRPVVNCRGTFTIISGSQSLPEVKQAMMEASKHYVHLDELMNAVSARLAELTQAPWGIVTAGCAAALTHATSVCIAGADPEKMQRLPKLAGLKNEVIIPKYSRNVYDHAVRTLGVDIIEPTTAEELERAFNARTAMVMIMSSPQAEKGPLSIPSVAVVAKKYGVPLIVDAAAEELTIPNLHLKNGATMVAYSGGKCLRGPQAAGLLLGPKDLLQAAWLNSAPHHAFGRALKVGKEEIMGMLAAVEMWTKRDHQAEWRTWESWLTYISDRVTKVPGVTTEVHQPEDLSNHAPSMRIKWDAAQVGISGRDVERLLLEGSPRIVVGGSNGGRGSASSITIMPYMMMPEDHKIAADALYALLAKPPKIDAPAVPTGAPATLGGQWQVHIDYLVGSADHVVVFEQTGANLMGTHASDMFTGDLRGKVAANQVSFRSNHHIQGTSIGYEFTGVANGDSMEGTVALGEYGTAKWTAKRHKYA